ncbi:MAG: GIY-YIG nuclease family protein [Candidatus Eremiobacteraeota bacterium]|nr:GIY-YIG nuclease family protein [Candidatus Eremiobacteraeota bacterium]
MIETVQDACSHFQTVAWSWLQSGEVTRTGYRLSPIEELCGFNYGFVYLMQVDAQCVKIGHSEHPMRRLRELRPEYGNRLRLVTCFVGEPPLERFAHRRFRNLRIRNEIFYAHPIIENYFAQTRKEMQERLHAVHICSSACTQLNKRLDLRMLGAWLGRKSS